MLPKDYFKRLFSKLNIKQDADGVTINYDLTSFGEKLDFAQDVVDNQIWHDMRMYMPHDTGELIRRTGELNANTRGEVYKYDPSLEYGRYQYEGEKYVDPVYGVGAFYDPDYGYWSRPGVSKVPSGQPLFYTQPMAEAHWDEVAVRNHEKQWVKLAKRSIET